MSSTFPEQFAFALAAPINNAVAWINTPCGDTLQNLSFRGGAIGLWDQLVQILALVTAAMIISALIAIPLGIFSSRPTLLGGEAKAEKKAAAWLAKVGCRFVGKRAGQPA